MDSEYLNFFLDSNTMKVNFSMTILRVTVFISGNVNANIMRENGDMESKKDWECLSKMEVSDMKESSKMGSLTVKGKVYMSMAMHTLDHGKIMLSMGRESYILMRVANIRENSLRGRYMGKG